MIFQTFNYLLVSDEPVCTITDNVPRGLFNGLNEQWKSGSISFVGEFDFVENKTVINVKPIH